MILGFQGHRLGTAIRRGFELYEYLLVIFKQCTINHYHTSISVSTYHILLGLPVYVYEVKTLVSEHFQYFVC